jgi:hypothetical protein
MDNSESKPLTEEERARKNKKAVKTRDGKIKRKRARNYSKKDILGWNFKPVKIPQEWVEHLGEIPDNARILVKGKPKNGKTEYLFKMTKMLCMDAGKKVHYNSTEQGKSKSIQAAFVRNKMADIRAGKWMLADATQNKFDPWFERLQGHNSGSVIVLDSIDYMKMTVEDFKRLHERFPKKMIIVVAWLPLKTQAKDIEFMVDMVIEVDDHYAKSISRFGGNKLYDIWPDRANYKQLPPSLFGPNKEQPEEPVEGKEPVQKEPDLMERDYNEESESMYAIQREIK